MAWFTPLAVLQVVLIAPGAMVDGFYTQVADVWWRNAFLDALIDRPAVMSVSIGCSLVAAYVVGRTWRSVTNY